LVFLEAKLASMTSDPQAGPPAPSRFPDPREASSEGLVAIGGLLEPDWLLDAYSHGVFPWPSDDDEPMLWWSPDPRAVMPLDRFYLSRRLRRRLRSGRFRLTCNTAFSAVLEGCATGPGREEGTWLTPAMHVAYERMHQLGHVHCVEAWIDHPGPPRLVGGVYGVAIGGLFSAESMFYRERDASKAALAALIAHLNARGYQLLDVQQWTEHTGALGAIELPRDEYLDQVAAAIKLPISFGETLEGLSSLGITS
jgi:leucyl/phenylalanyl-tRNA--protein transferase